MWPLIAIKFLVFFHAVVTLIAIIGAVVTWTGYFKERKTLLRIYFTTITLVALSYIISGACVLTTLERFLRREYAPSTVYSEGFIAHSLHYVGISIADITSFWIVTTMLIVGALGLMYHHTNIRKVFKK